MLLGVPSDGALYGGMLCESRACTLASGEAALTSSGNDDVLDVVEKFVYTGSRCGCVSYRCLGGGWKISDTVGTGVWFVPTDGAGVCL